MLRNLLRRFGVLRLSAGLTLISVVLSVVITTLIGLVLSQTGPGGTGLAIAIAVPLLIAPLMSYQMLALLDRLDRTEERLRALSITDDLTQAFNRRYFITLAEAELARMRRYGGQGAIAILDLDDFKQVNDTQGHMAGDTLLRDFAKLCRQTLRAADTFARYGGDEFIMLLPGATPAVAHEVVERIRKLLTAPAGKGNTGGLGRSSLSAGIAAISAETGSLDQIIKSADEALYAAKRAGGNQVVELPR